LSYLTLNIVVTLKCGLEVIQHHSNWYHQKLGYGFLFTVCRSPSMAVSLAICRVRFLPAKTWGLN